MKVLMSLHSQHHWSSPDGDVRITQKYYECLNSMKVPLLENVHIATNVHSNFEACYYIFCLSIYDINWSNQKHISLYILLSSKECTLKKRKKQQALPFEASESERDHSPLLASNEAEEAFFFCSPTIGKTILQFQGAFKKALLEHTRRDLLPISNGKAWNSEHFTHMSPLHIDIKLGQTIMICFSILSNSLYLSLILLSS